MKEGEILRACDQHSNETVTFRKHVIKYEHIRKLMVAFLSKFESSGIKIVRVNSIRITILSIYFNFVRVPFLSVTSSRTLYLMSSTVNHYTLERSVHAAI